MDGLDQFVLGVALAEAEGQTQVIGQTAQTVLDTSQGDMTVVAGFPDTEQIQVGTVEDKDGCHGEVFARAGRNTELGRLRPDPGMTPGSEGADCADSPGCCPVPC